MSDRSSSNSFGSSGGEKKQVVNSLLNAFVPEDLVTFGMQSNMAHPITLLPTTLLGGAIEDTTSEIDLGGEDDELENETQRDEILMQEPVSKDVLQESMPFLSDLVSDLQWTHTLPPPQHDGSIGELLKAGSGTDSSPISVSAVYREASVSVFSGPSIPATDAQHITPTPPPSSFTSGVFHFQPTTPLPLQLNSNPLPPLGSSDQNAAGITNRMTQPVSGPSNYFRMGNQKKPSYAKYPGISSQSHQSSPQQHQLPQQPPVGLLSFDGGSGLSNVASPTPLFPPPPQILSITPSEAVTPVPQQPPPISTKYGAAAYKPVSYHWFFRKDGELWKPFSHIDSKALEEAFIGSKRLVSVDGGRQDVDMEERLRKPIYWEDTDLTHVQRCSWFYKGPMDSQFMPYAEEFSTRLEEEYELSCRTHTWQKRLEFPGGEAVVLQGPHSFVHFCQQASADEWGSVPENQLRPRIVKRGTDGLQIPPGEPLEIDYLVFLVHGIGSFCDFKFRTVVETVDDFRQISNQLLQTHFKEITGRVEFLPIQWHKALHGDGGIDDKLKPLTLKSIPKLRHFTNDTLLDILFYTSPVYCQTIMNTVGTEMNRMYNLFLERNPTFNCLSVAVAGHSLGSLILFDLLAHQPEMVPTVNPSQNTQSEVGAHSEKCEVDGKESENRLVSYRMGSAGTGQPFISYPVLDFQPTAFFAMGSPIAMFVAVRGLDSLGLDFHFPTCPAFYNIFHPFDPVAYRMESLIDPTLDLRPVLIPHHKGRKRFHLELKETMTRVGTDLKNRVMESLRVTYNAVAHLAGMAEVEQEVDMAIASELNGDGGAVEERSAAEEGEKTKRIGSLNGGRRIDYVLQEAPHQILNEYLFALSSHVCYWESEDTALLMLNEILNEGRSSTSTPEPGTPTNLPTQPFLYPMPTPAPSQEQHGAFLPDMEFQSLPQPMNPVVPPVAFDHHIPPSPLPGSAYTTGKRPVADFNSIPFGMDPTAPISMPAQLPPPPKAGFLPKN